MSRGISAQMVGFGAVLLSSVALGNPNVHVTYHWHQHQPIYWPETNPGTNRYQFAHDSILLKLGDTGNYYTGSTAEHPQNHLWQGDGGAYDDVFSKADRINAYQHGMRNSIDTIDGYANAGVSISYSGSLQENIGSLGRANYGGYYSTWNSPTVTARGWTTNSGKTRADLVGMTYHHSFGPLLPKSVLRKEIEIFREIWWKSWGGNPNKSDHSKGFWPIECAFSRHMIPVLKEFGYEWSIVANSHLARTCQNYLTIAPSPATSTWNNVPPNRADRLGPTVPAGQWWSGTIDGRGGTFPAPYAYQAHKAQYIDPYTGVEETMVVVPMCDQLSYQNGFGTMGTGEIDSEIAPFATDSNHPVIVLMAHDGDNAWGGGSSYYNESVPGLMGAVAGQGYTPSTIEHYLSTFDTSSLDVVHVEDGSWVNADDRGSPAFYHWLFPPQTDRGSSAYDSNDVKTWTDVTNPGFSEDFRNWAVMVAGANYLETAEALWLADSGTVSAWKIQEPSQNDGTNNNPNIVEQGWHYFLGGLDSGFLYYGSSLDDEMKLSLAQRRALDVDTGSGSLKSYVDARIGTEVTPPTVFKPQRWPWNPGGKDWGNHVGYRAVGFNGVDPWDSEFHVWTHVYDVAGVDTVTLRVRVDGDGVNSMSSTDNETYAGGSEVGSWIDIAMTKRTMDPTFNPDSAPGDNPNDPGDINFFIQPHAIADYYYALVDDSVITDIRGKLVDYYVVATDDNGNEQRSEIQHVFVEDDGDVGGGGDGPDTPENVGASVTGTDSATVVWDASAGATEYVVKRGGVEVGTVTGTSFVDSGLTAGETYCYIVAAHNGDGTSEDSPTSCVTIPAVGGGPIPFVMDGLADYAGYLLSNPGMTLYAAVRDETLYVATWNPEAGNGNDHFIKIGAAPLAAPTGDAPWGKAGGVALETTAPFLAAESTNGFIDWFNTGASVVEAARGGAGEQMEGLVNLVAAFGSLPGSLSFTACAFQTADGGALSAQAPDGNGDGNVDPAEVFTIPLEALRDENANGIYDRLEPDQTFQIAEFTRDSATEVTLTWNCFPGRSYQIQSRGEGSGWGMIYGSLVAAGASDLTLSLTLSAQSEETALYRVVLLASGG